MWLAGLMGCFVVSEVQVHPSRATLKRGGRLNQSHFPPISS